MSELASMKDFQKKYRKNIAGISTKNNVDLGAATDMFVSNLRGKGNYAGGGTLDFNEPIKDYNQLRSDLLLEKEMNQATKEPTQASQVYSPLNRAQALKQAQAEIAPGYESAIGQMREQVATTRQATPQALGARGQTLGGVRTAREEGLTRTEAYQTADLQAQQALAEQQRATELVSARDAQIAQEQARQDALQQQQFSNQLALRSAELQEQGFTADEAYRQATLEANQAAQAESTRQFDVTQAEQQRQFGLEYGLDAQTAALNQQYKQAQIDAMNAPTATGTTRDLSDYANIAFGLEGQNRIDYINNLKSTIGLTSEEENYLKGLTGVQAATTTTTIDPRSATPGIGARGGMTTTTTPESVIGYQPTTEVTPDPTYTFDLPNADAYIKSQDIGQLDADGNVIIGSTDKNKVLSTLSALLRNGQVDDATFDTLFYQYGLEELLE